MHTKPLSFGAAIFILIAGSNLLHAGQYFQDFSAFSIGATSFDDGSQLFSTSLGTVGGAGVQNGTYKELQLTEFGYSSISSAFELPDLDPGAPVYAFSVKWNSQVYGNFPNAADGFSFNFGQLSSLNLISGGYSQESGYPTGLCFSVQSYVNNNPGFYLRVNGNTLASVPFNPSTQWQTNNSARHFFEVDWNYLNGLTVQMDGQIIFSNAPTYGFIPHAGDRMVWAARCGGDSEEVRLDNIVAMTGGNLVQVPTTSPYYSDTNAVMSAANAFDGNLNTVWEDYNLFTSPLGYVGATLPAMADVGAYVLVSPPAIGGLAGPQSAPAGWDFEGSNNQGTNWTSCGTGHGSFLNSLESRCWLATNTTSFGAYRLNVTAPNGYVGLGLAELRFYQFNPITTAGWTQTSAPNNYWETVASSADGRKLFAATGDVNNPAVFMSSDAGTTWGQINAPAPLANFILASSADGMKLILSCHNLDNTGELYTSPNGGTNWIQANLANQGWDGVASSADGSQLWAAAYDLNGGVWKSTDSGTNWKMSSLSEDFSTVATSTNGSKVMASSQTEGGYVSTNYGTNWTRVEPAGDWSLACSGDGTTMVFAANGNYIDISRDSGQTFQHSSAPFYGWSCVACSADGKTIVGAGFGGGIYLSTDSGNTWTRTLSPNARWSAITMSADGTKMVATVGGGNIWTYEHSLTPQPPTASTSAASGTSVGGATLNGQANPNYLPTTVWFQWGTTISYSNTTAMQSAGDGSDDGNVASMSSFVGGLLPGTTYHYRMVALNNFGTNYGNDMTFTTLPATDAFNIAVPGDFATATSTNWPAGQDATMAIDGTASTKYLNFDITNTGFIVFPTITNYPVRALGFISAEDSPERDPANFILYGSQDGTNFTFITSNSIPLFVSRNAIQSIAFANANTYAAYKIIFPTVVDPTNANSMQIAEVELLPYGDITSTNDVLTLLLPAGASLAAVTPTNALLDRILFGDANKVVVLNDTTNVVAIITPATGATIAKGVELIGGDDDATYPEREPVSFTLEGSNDGTNFTTLLSINPQAPTANMQIQGYSLLGNANSFRQYRATFGVPQSGDILQIGELRLFGVTATPNLSIVPSGAKMILSWPTIFSGYTLQTTTNLTGVNWQDYTGNIGTDGSSFFVTNGVSTGNVFFRLKQ